MPIKDPAAYAQYMRGAMRRRRQQRRATLIEMAGGVCITCSSDQELNFDHRDPATKLFELSGCALDKAWAKILEEYAKCDLLCRPCHLVKTRQDKL